MPCGWIASPLEEVTHLSAQKHTGAGSRERADVCHLAELQSCQGSTVDADRKHTVRSIDQILPEAMGEGHAAGDKVCEEWGR